MSRRFFGSDFDSDYFEGYLDYPPMKGNGHKDLMALHDNLPAFPQAPLITGGKIVITDYCFGVPYKKRKVNWMNVHTGGSSRRLGELDVCTKMLQIMKKHELL